MHIPPSLGKGDGGVCEIPIGITLVYIHELSVRARQLASVAQLVRVLHWNHRATGSIPQQEGL